MPGAGGRTAIAIPKDLFDSWDKSKIKLAVELQKIPTNPQMVRAAIVLFDKYQSEAVKLIADMRED
jgi:hypothetical protein